jgi:hypothetical protein
VRLDWIVVGRPVIILPVLAHIAVHSLPHPDIAARVTQELRSTSGQFNEVREVSRRSACVVLQKRKKINDGHASGILSGTAPPPILMWTRASRSCPTAGKREA